MNDKATAIDAAKTLQELHQVLNGVMEAVISGTITPQEGDLLKEKARQANLRLAPRPRR